MTRRSSHNSGSWSLRGRVLLLAGSAVFLLLTTLGILIAVVRNTQAALVNNAASHLERIALRSAASYQSRADRTFDLSSLRAMNHSIPPPPPPPALDDSRREGGRPDSPPVQASSQPQDKPGTFMSGILRLQPGVEGGFYRAETDELGGYAFPTHEGPGPAKEMPLREQPTIRDVSREAAQTNRPKRFVFAGPHDVVLFSAVPVCDEPHCNGAATGALWLMQRLPGAETDRRRAVLWSAFGFGLMALLVVALAFAVLSQVDRSVRSVLDRLRGMESSLEPQPDPAAGEIRMVEFQRVMRGLTSLATTLRTQRETELALQARLQQHERLAAIGQLAAGVAHELRNPLATIRLRAQLAQRSTDLEASARNSAVVLSEVDRLDTIVQGLLTFARPVRLDSRLTDVTLLCGEAAVRWAAQGAASGHVVRCTSTEPVHAELDAARIRQVLDNLLENAMHASGGRAADVTITCEQQDGMTLIRVTDRGSGFREDVMQRAMEPFFTTRDNGTGLGLSIAYEIVRAHGGELRLSNAPEGGAVAEVLLPSHTDEENERAHG